MTLLLLHGAWHDGSIWQGITEPMLDAGFQVITPTLSGFEHRQQAPDKEIGLYTHIHEIVGLILKYDLDDLVLVGHSYAGFVIMGVADQLPDKVRKLVFLDAFVPSDKQSLFDLMPTDWGNTMRSIMVDEGGKTKAEGATDSWLIPPPHPSKFGINDPKQVQWVQSRMNPTPVRTFEEKLRFSNTTWFDIPQVYIRCTQHPTHVETEKRVAQMGWEVIRIDTGHDPMITHPQMVSDILRRVMES